MVTLDIAVLLQFSYPRYSQYNVCTLLVSPGPEQRAKSGERSVSHSPLLRSSVLHPRSLAASSALQPAAARQHAPNSLTHEPNSNPNSPVM